MMNFTKHIVALCLALLFSTSAFAQLSNEEKAIALIAAFETGDQTALDYVSDDMYIQHNLSAPDGKDFLNNFLTGQPTGFTTVTARTFEVDDIVVMHNVYGGAWNGGTPQVAFDVFRFEDGLIVEHWDNLQDITDDMDGTSQTDGPITPVSDTSSTAANQMLLEEMTQTLFIDGDWTNLRSYFNLDAYIQHSVGAGADGAFLETLEGATGLSFYDDIKFIYTLGNFGLTMSQGPDISGQDTVGTYAYYDLFRMEEGLIVEHWDVIQIIPPQEEWANNNGKWGDDAIVTSIEDEAIPREALLMSISNAPNPFNGNTQFEVMADQSDEYTFKVYDATGREVYREKMILSEGMNTFLFKGHHLSNGLYLYQIGNNESLAQGKMILVK